MIGRTIRGPRIRRPPQTGWNSKNIVDFAESILPIRKRNKVDWVFGVGVVSAGSGGLAVLYLLFQGLARIPN